MTNFDSFPAMIRMASESASSSSNDKSFDLNLSLYISKAINESEALNG